MLICVDAGQSLRRQSCCCLVCAAFFGGVALVLGNEINVVGDWAGAGEPRKLLNEDPGMMS